MCEVTIGCWCNQVYKCLIGNVYNMTLNCFVRLKNAIEERNSSASLLSSVSTWLEVIITINTWVYLSISIQVCVQVRNLSRWKLSIQHKSYSRDNIQISTNTDRCCFVLAWQSGRISSLITWSICYQTHHQKRGKKSGEFVVHREKLMSCVVYCVCLSIRSIDPAIFFCNLRPGNSRGDDDVCCICGVL